jgi:hypothetical protein
MLGMINSKNIGKNKILLDIGIIFIIVSIFINFLSIFGFNVPTKMIVGVPLFIFIYLFMSFISFEWRMKQYGWLFSHTLFFIGGLIQMFSLGQASVYNLKNKLSDSGGNINAQNFEVIARDILPDTALSSAPNIYSISFIIGFIISLIGLISIIIFYYKYYRKYLTGQMTLMEIGKGKFGSEKEISKRWESSEKKQNVVNWIMITLIVIVVLFIIGSLIRISIING